MGVVWHGAQVPVWLLKATRSFLRSFQWARDAADRLVLPLSRSPVASHLCNWVIASTSLSPGLFMLRSPQMQLHGCVAPLSRCCLLVLGTLNRCRKAF